MDIDRAQPLSRCHATLLVTGTTTAVIGHFQDASVEALGSLQRGEKSVPRLSPLLFFSLARSLFFARTESLELRDTLCLCFKMSLSNENEFDLHENVENKPVGGIHFQMFRTKTRFYTLCVGATSKNLFVFFYSYDKIPH